MGETLRVMKQCPFCASALPDDATVCKVCKQALPSKGSGAAPVPPPAPVRKKKGSGLVWAGGMVLGALLVLGIVGLMAFRATPARSGMDTRHSLVAQGINTARTISNQKEQCSNPAAVADAWRNIKQVQKGDPQWDEAKQMAQQLEVCRAEIERTLSSTLNDLRHKQRQDWAQRAQATLQARVLDANVTLSGQSQEEAVISASQLDQGIIDRVTDGLSMQQGSFLEGFQKLGGARVVFTNGKHTWPYDLPNTPETQDNLTVLRGMGLGSPLVLE
jgi:hypothetical protein